MKPSRRTVLKSICFSAAALSVPTPVSGSVRIPGSKIRLGLIADVHIGFVDDAQGRLELFLDQMAQLNPDGVMQLGDFAYPNAEHQPLVDKFNSSNENAFHVIGNHDLDLGLTKSDAIKSWGIPHAFYSKDLNGIRILVLDGNDQGSPTYETHGGYHTYVGEEQLKWLRTELESSARPVLVASHQPLAGKSAVDNAEQVQQLLSEFRHKVIVCINGHSHLDQHVVVGGVNYVHINSASYYWLGGKVRLAKYQDALFTMLEIDPELGTVQVEEKVSQWADKTPADSGYFEGGKNDDLRKLVEPRISDRAIQSRLPQVIDVYLLGGQSNMQGVGRIEEITEEQLNQARVQMYHSEALAGPANQWVPNHACGYQDSYFGPEVGLGHTLSQLDANANIALIKHAVGGTDLARQWNPGEPGKPDTQGGQYRKFMKTVRDGLERLRQENRNCKIRVRAMLWQQGERDSRSEDFANLYEENLRTLVERVREDLDIENLPFIYGKVHDSTLQEVPSYRFNDKVIEAQSNVDQNSMHSNAMTGAHVIESGDLEVHGDLKDGFRDKDFAHFSTDGNLKLGREYAKLANGLSTVAKNSSSKRHRVLSYNTYYAFDHRKQIEEGKTWIRSMAPDIVALQELTDVQPEQLAEWAEQWGHEHSCLLKSSGFSVGITAREPLTVITKRIKNMHHGYLHVECNAVHYFVVHLSPFSFEKRLEETGILLEEIRPLVDANEKVVVLGDFNAFTPDDRPILASDAKLLEKMREQDKTHGHVQNLNQEKIDYSVMEKFHCAGLIDTASTQIPFVKERRLTLPTGIWGDKKTAVQSGQRVDYILATPNLSADVVDSIIPTKGVVNQISDHYPVVTDFLKR